MALVVALGVFVHSSIDCFALMYPSSWACAWFADQIDYYLVHLSICLELPETAAVTAAERIAVFVLGKVGGLGAVV